MDFYKIGNLKKVKVLKKYFRKPNFVSKTLINKFYNLLKKEDFNKFVKLLTNFIKNKKLGSSKLFHIFFYMEYLLEKDDIYNKKLIRKISVNLKRDYYLGFSNLGFSSFPSILYHQEIFKYIRKNTNLIYNTKNYVFIDDKYFSKLFDLENKLNKINKNTDKYLKEYISTLDDLLRDKQITKRLYNKILELLHGEILLGIDFLIDDGLGDYESLTNKYFSKPIIKKFKL